MEGRMPPEVSDHPDVQVFDEIRWIENLARTHMAKALPVGLTYPQFEVLNLLSRRGDDITPRQIAEALQLTKNGLTHTLQLLCVRSLVQVEACPEDGRKKRVRMTPDGRRAYAQAMTALRPKMEGLRDGFTPKEFRDALPFLRALRSWLAEKD
jgi:DNA-binding MarR family transcriptional regulator